MKSLFLFASTTVFVAAAIAADIENFGPSLDEDIVAIYVAPTRSDEPFVATAAQLLQYDKKEKAWQTRYSPPWSDAIIQGMSGYAKSSQMIYVVHTQGIAASRDGGQSWTESVPPDFGSATGKLVSVVVHPENRKEAVFAFENASWVSRDYGVNFEAILPGERFAGATYASGEPGEMPERGRGDGYGRSCGYR